MKFVQTVHTQQFVDTLGVGSEFYAGFHLQASGMGQVHFKIISETRGLGAHDCNVGSQQDGFLDAVGNKNNRLLTLSPDVQQFEIHLFAGQGI